MTGCYNINFFAIFFKSIKLFQKPIMTFFFTIFYKVTGKNNNISFFVLYDFIKGGAYNCMAFFYKVLLSYHVFFKGFSAGAQFVFKIMSVCYKIKADRLHINTPINHCFLCLQLSLLEFILPSRNKNQYKHRPSTPS